MDTFYADADRPKAPRCGRAFRAEHGEHRRPTLAREHGQWWVICRDCGATWAVEPGPRFERIDRGDGYCEGER